MRLQNRPGQRAPKGVSGYAFRREKYLGRVHLKLLEPTKLNGAPHHSTTA
ncbi:hypothetical protein [Vibrio quintilis]|nr:hypothetical protein [Vibrio quintilis]